jgi:branched-chain amino acid transport system substrate-binding protein
MFANRVFSAIASCFLAATCCMLTGCPSSTENANTIKIVSSLPRTGSAKAQTDTIVNGIKIALEEANYKVGDFTIEYVDMDDATAGAGDWTPEQEAANARRAVSDPNVMVYIGPYNSGAAKVSMPILNNAGVLMISPAVTNPALTKPGHGEGNEPFDYRPSGKVNFFRVLPADDLQGPLSAHWALKRSMSWTTIRCMAKALPICLPKSARIWASKSWGTKVWTTKLKSLSL